MKEMGISVVIPSYNAAGWLPTTIKKVEAALVNSGVPRAKTEIIVVDDGSTDDTKRVVAAIAKGSNVRVSLITEKNQGRYFARKNGVSKAKFSYVWFVDTRVYVAPSSLKYVASEMKKTGDNAVWNAHVTVRKEGNIIARFMDAITFIGWRRYFKKPRRSSYGLKDFDHYPKGTTSFLAPKQVLLDAMREFEKEDRDMKHSSDDTHLIRLIARDSRINLSPKFSCTYHARTTFKGFIGQAFYRGQTFIDGFLRPGTRFYIPLITVLVASAVAVLVMVVAPSSIVYVLGLFATLWLSGLIAALLLGVDRKDALSLFALSPFFSVAYGAGLWVATLKKWWRYVMSPANRANVIGTIVALVFFSACTGFYYLGNSATSCTTTLAAGPGDQTGLIWLNSTVNAPLWGSTDVTNAPYGESLQSPTHITGALEYLIYWLAAQMVGSVCGYGLFTSIALIASATIVFFFTRSLVHRNDVAIFASFAASFTPYIQIKTGVHPSYVFFGVFVLTVWLALKLWYTPSLAKAVALGLVISSYFYLDPYFSLLGGVVVLTTFLAFTGRLLYRLYRAWSDSPARAAVMASLRRFMGFAMLSVLVVIVVGLVPLLWVKHTYSDQIDREVGSVRSDIKLEAFTYAARPAEYFLPNLYNPYIANLGIPTPEILTRKAHGSNPAEDTVSLSLAVVALATGTVLVATAQVLRKRTRNRSLPLFSRKQLLAIVLLAAIGLLAFLTSLPPKSHGFVFPSEFITNYITVWRVFARLAIVVMFCVAIIAAIGLAALTQRLRTWGRRLVIGLLILVVGFEYLTFIPFHDTRGWSYNQTNSFYKWLNSQSDIKLIAEYPLNEPGQTSVSVDYFRDQFTHKKHIINAFRAASPQARMRNGIRDLTDPQTAPALASLGVDLVVVHAEDHKPLRVPAGLEIFDWNHSELDPDSIYTKGKMWVLKVVAQPDSDGLLLVPGAEFNEVRINSTYTEAEYVFRIEAQLSFATLRTGEVTTNGCLCRVSMRVISTVPHSLVSISQNGKELWRGDVGQTPRDVTFRTAFAKGELRLHELSRPSENGIIISNIDLTK